MKKLTILLFIFGGIMACSDPSISSSDGDMGKNVYEKNCKLCHGIDGSMQMNGAKDLNLSTLSKKERIHIITNGKNVMVPFKDVLSKAEIEAVANYTIKTFKK